MLFLNRYFLFFVINTLQKCKKKVNTAIQFNLYKGATVIPLDLVWDQIIAIAVSHADPSVLGIGSQCVSHHLRIEPEA